MIISPAARRSIAMLFARTIQGVGTLASANGRQPLKGATLNYNQSWLCAL